MPWKALFYVQLNATWSPSFSWGNLTPCCIVHKKNAETNPNQCLKENPLRLLCSVCANENINEISFWQCWKLPEDNCSSHIKMTAIITQLKVHLRWSIVHWGDLATQPFLSHILWTQAHMCGCHRANEKWGKTLNRKYFSTEIYFINNNKK